MSLTVSYARPNVSMGKQLGKKEYKISRFMSKLWDATKYGGFLVEETGQAGLGQRNLHFPLLWKVHGSCVKEHKASLSF